MSNTTPSPTITNLPSEPAANPLIRLLTSSKALVVLAVTIACFAALFAKHVEWKDMSDFLKWVLGPWLLAQGAEDAAKSYGLARARGDANTQPPVTNVAVNVPSNAPPAL